MPFPVICDISDVTKFIQHVPQIRVKADEEFGLTVICYMLQDDDVFSGENESIERECRGITFGKDGKIVSRHLHKFFNVGERESTLPENINWSKVTRIMEKRDGSMVVPVPLVGGGFKFKTKKSFHTNEATLADSIASTPGCKEWIQDILNQNLTPTFEVTSPRFPIVLRYNSDELTLLHIRENNSGRYLTEAELSARGCPFPLVKNFMSDFLEGGNVSWEKLKSAALTTQNFEGWVIQFESGDMVKLKTKWYCDLHRTIVFLRERDVARLALDDKIDDLIGQFALVDKDPTPVRRINNIVLADLAELQAEVEAEHAKLVGKTKKEAALAAKGHRLFGLIMRAMDGKEINLREWYNKHVLEHKFSLAVLDAGEQLIDGDI